MKLVIFLLLVLFLFYLTGCATTHYHVDRRVSVTSGQCRLMCMDKEVNFFRVGDAVCDCRKTAMEVKYAEAVNSSTKPIMKEFGKGPGSYGLPILSTVKK